MIHNILWKLQYIQTTCDYIIKLNNAYDHLIFFEYMYEHNNMRSNLKKYMITYVLKFFI